MFETLTTKGLWMDLTQRDKFVGIIGSRKPSPEEEVAARTFAYRCAKAGYVVVSGLAEGIDTEAHLGAIEGGGKTIAVVSYSINESIYPESNQALAEEIIKKGCIIHPYQITPWEADRLYGKEKGMNRRQKRLLERNLLVAYLCPKIVSVKGTDEKITGGTKWATHYGEVYKKEVHRLDGEGKLHPNPSVEECETWWDIEMEFLKKIISEPTNKEC